MASPFAFYRRLPNTRRRLRRLTVIGTFAGYPLVILGYANLAEPGHLPDGVWAPIAVALMAATILGIFAVYGFANDHLRDRDQLDERQRAMSDRALVMSYGVVTTVLVLALSALATATALGGPITVDLATLTPILIAAGVFIPLLPFAALAWIEPDPNGDDRG